MKKGFTVRGFAKYEFTDLYGSGCSLQKSSLATEDAIWLGVDDTDPMVLASRAHLVGVKTSDTTGWVPYPIPEEVSIKTRMHLNREQAEALIEALQHFVDSGELPEEVVGGQDG